MTQKFNLRLQDRSLYFLGGFGIVFICVAIFVGFKALPDTIRDKIWEMKVLKENTEQWNIFLKFPYPFTFKVYIFSVQNPDEILQGAKPIMKEVGPYVYRVWKWKSEVERTSDDITYNAYQKFEFDKISSGNHSDEDILKVLNIPYLSILLKVEQTRPDATSMVEPVLPDIFGEIDGLFINVKVKDYLFNGLKFCEHNGNSGGFVSSTICKKVRDGAGNSKNLRVENDAIYYSNLNHKNNTPQGKFTVKSGISNRKETGQLILINNKSYISNWIGDTSKCNQIRGVTTIFPTNINKRMDFESFSKDVCRTIPLVYNKEQVVNGVLGYRFSAAEYTFSYRRKDNECFCVNKTGDSNKDTGCLSDGIMDLSMCTGGPVMLSFPHLLYANKKYTSSINGLKPNKSEHETFIILEPLSGYPLEVAQRVQFNMFIRPIRGLSIMENVTGSLIPLTWIEENVRLDTGTIQWNRFIDLPIAFNLKIYFFVVQNYNEVLNNRVIPIVKEVGPYHYQETKHKHILEMDDNDDTVSFQQTMSIKFDQNASRNLKEDDILTFINPVLLVLSQITSPLERLAFTGCLDKIMPNGYRSIFINTTVKTMVFEGFTLAGDRNIGPACNVIRNQVIQKTANMKNIQRELDKNGDIKGLKFSYLKYKRDFTDGVYTTNRGRKDITKLGQIMKWNRKETLDIWGISSSINNSTCKRIRGTDSTLYPPHIQKQSSFEIFSTDICRTISITYSGIDTYMGVEGYRFEINKDILWSKNPKYDCYCSKQSMDEHGQPNCYLDGVLDVAPCFGEPVLFSFPHFLYADQKYLNGVQKLCPQESLHKIFLIVEPNTGTPLVGNKRVQLNIVIRPVSFFHITDNLPATVLPLLWIDESASLSQDLVNELKSKLFDTQKLVNGLIYGLIAIIAGCIFILSVYLIKRLI